MVLWLRLHTSTAGNLGSISGRQTKIQGPVAAKKKKKKRMAFRVHRSSYCATLNRSLKTVVFLTKLELIRIVQVRISQWKKRKRTRNRRSLNDPSSSDMKSTQIDLVLIRKKSHGMRWAHLLFPCIWQCLYPRGWCNPKGTWLTSLWFPMGWCWLSHPTMGIQVLPSK